MTTLDPNPIDAVRHDTVDGGRERAAMVRRGLLTLALWASLAAEAPARQDEEPVERSVRFTYATTITALPPGATVKVWIPLAADDEHQRAEIVALDVPGESRRTTERRFGNRLLYTEAVAGDDGTLPLSIEYAVTRRPVERGQGPKAEQAERFLQPDRLVPTEGTAFDALLAEIPADAQPAAVARELFDRVDARMRYDKPPGEAWGRGDSLWACSSGYGNCTDFHSLFMSLSRRLELPARFEMGFSLPPARGTGSVTGYHCWAWFLDGERWAPVDISEADKHPEQRESCFAQLDNNRIGFTIGRDLQLDPPPAAGPVNFLVYPYVEVDGQPHASMQHRFAFEDV